MHFPTQAGDLHREPQGISAAFLMALGQMRDKWKKHVTWLHKGHTVIITEFPSDTDKTNPAAYKHALNAKLNDV